MAQSREQAFDALMKQASADATRDARDFLAGEAGRVDRFQVSTAALTADFSKQDMSGEAMAALLAYAEACDLRARVSDLAAGVVVNVTEKRAASHMALRGSGTDDTAITQASAELDRVCEFAASVRDGRRSGATGRRFNTIIHIGIGGSDLGPRLAWKALRPAGADIDIRFLASPDPANFERATRGLDPAETLVFVVSKSFGTAETRLNAQVAREWLAGALGEGAVSAHLVSATASPQAARDFGVPDDAIFEMWDWVGGRYSLWSAVSLSVVCGLGEAVFRSLLAGAAAMDTHFLGEGFERNLPVMMALTAFWNRACRGRDSHGIVPYAAPLALLPAWLQQLSMESLGKRVTPGGEAVTGETGAAIWGAEGPNGQHAFFQMLHQGTSIIPADLIAVAWREGADAPGRMMLANALAQAEALLKGRTRSEAAAELRSKGVGEADAARLAPHLEMPGGRPTTLLVLDRLDAPSVGALLALYEHSVFVQSVLFDVNAFDQYGVELGKTLASVLEDELETGVPGAHDPSTQSWITRLSGAD
tara:strand:+ start:578 stop:2185 length:1608 start_codon:yes stop_codon:yes gene_type:complete